MNRTWLPAGCVLRSQQIIGIGAGITEMNRTRFPDECVLRSQQIIAVCIECYQPTYYRSPESVGLSLMGHPDGGWEGKLYTSKGRLNRKL